MKNKSKLKKKSQNYTWKMSNFVFNPAGCIGAKFVDEAMFCFQTFLGRPITQNRTSHTEMIEIAQLRRIEVFGDRESADSRDLSFFVFERT